MVQAEDWLSAIAGDNPSGIDLRNDPRFHAIERLMEPAIDVERDDQNNPVGGSAAAVAWDDVLEQADALKGDGRDLRLLVIATRALANTQGYTGVAEGLDLIVRTLDEYWDSVHPELREGRPPREAALRRINALQQLQNDDDGMLGDLEGNVHLSPRGIGPITGRDLAAAMLDQNTLLREAPSGLGDKEKASLIAAHEATVQRVKAGCRAEADQNREAMDALAAGVSAANTALSGLEAKLAEKLGEDGAGPKLSDLSMHLERVGKTLGAILAQSEVSEPPAVDETKPVTNVTAPGAAADVASPQTAGGGGGVPNQINSRKEVERCLDLIIDFYERTEPASPLPHLAKRMRRMVPMDFVELIQEVAPGGLKDFNVAVGAKDDKK